MTNVELVVKCTLSWL